MNTRRLTTGSLMVVGGLLGASHGAHADIKYTTEMRMGAAGADAKPLNTTTNYIMEGAQRTETHMGFGPMQISTVELTLCEKRQKVKLDDGLKIYTVADLEGKAASAPAGAAGAAAVTGTPRGEGKISVTTSVKDLGEEVVAEVKTEHYMISSHMQMSGCAGNTAMDMKMETWVGPSLTTELKCDVAPVDPARMMARVRPTCKLTFEQHGDAAAYGKVLSGIIMRMKMYQGNSDQPMMIQEVTGLSRAKLDAAMFAVPADYKQVSEAEFAKAQQKAMMDATMKGLRAGATGAGGNAGEAGANGAANGGGANNGDQGNGGANGGATNGGANNGDAGNGATPPPQEEPKKKKKPKLPFKLPF